MSDNTALIKKVIEKNFCGLNPPQFKAVTTVNGPLLVLAGAGSGKTTVLVNRILCIIRYGNAYNEREIFPVSFDVAAAEAYLSGKTEEPPHIVLPGCAKPWEILAITFTNKAAGEMCDRIERALGEDGAGVTAGTFHSVAARILRRHADRLGHTSHFTIYDTDDQKRLLKNLYKELNIDDKMLPLRSVMGEISSCKTEMVSPEEYLKTGTANLRAERVAGIYAAYEKALRAADAMDFDDLLINLTRLLEQHPDVRDYYQNRFKYILVDEYQDTNRAQYLIVKLLAGKRANLCVVGDDDQSIYRFRGATIENILSFEEQYPDAAVIRLEQNYRSTGNILDAANAVIKNNDGRKGKTLWTDNPAGERIEIYSAVDEQDEARHVADAVLDGVRAGIRYSQNAVLYRMNAQSNAIENAFVRSGIPYRIIGGHRFYERKEIKDAVAYLSVVANPNDRIRLTRIINEPKRGIGQATVDTALEISDSLGMPIFEVLKNAADYPMLSRAAGKLKAFTDLVEELISFAASSSIAGLLDAVLERTGYMAALEAAGNAEKDRVENLRELSSNVIKYEEDTEDATLNGFLEEVALVSDIDEYDRSADTVVLMTLHSAKGLEFDNVYIIGVEEGIFPGMQTIMGDKSDMEEERRLAYVGITRAKKVLCISHANTRMIFGKTERYLPSRFIAEIPKTLTKQTAGKAPNGNFVSFGYGHPATHGARTGSSDSFSFVPNFKSGGGIAKRPAQAGANAGVTYSVGESVRHRTFGDGVILRVTKMGSDSLLEIAFSDVGTKRIMSNFAKLEKI